MNEDLDEVSMSMSRLCEVCVRLGKLVAGFPSMRVVLGTFLNHAKRHRRLRELLLWIVVFMRTPDV